MSKIYGAASGFHNNMLERIRQDENAFVRGLGWLILHGGYLLVAVIFGLAFFIDWEIPVAIIIICIIIELVYWIGDRI
ncbi:MAG: hypothetical protein KGH66_01790 [Candidatus Micrarchaeota archaeon]|nr:hypothetical protein [Candidatus Micrarchaeota archaeon]